MIRLGIALKAAGLATAVLGGPPIAAIALAVSGTALFAWSVGRIPTDR